MYYKTYLKKFSVLTSCGWILNYFQTSLNYHHSEVFIEVPVSSLGLPWQMTTNRWLKTTLIYSLMAVEAGNQNSWQHHALSKGSKGESSLACHISGGSRCSLACSWRSLMSASISFICLCPLFCFLYDSCFGFRAHLVNLGGSNLVIFDFICKELFLNKIIFTDSRS
jgi:hypothetical protein